MRSLVKQPRFFKKFRTYKILINKHLPGALFVKKI